MPIKAKKRNLPKNDLDVIENQADLVGHMKTSMTIDSDSEENGSDDDNETELSHEDNFKDVVEQVNYAEDHDVSDEEDLRNTVGNIPMKWYERCSHLGYNLDGKPISKPIRNLDELDKFLDKMENKNFWKTIYDQSTGTNHVLNEEEQNLISRLERGGFYSSEIDPHAPYEDIFTHEEMIHPLSNAPAHKRSFLPSKSENEKIGRLVNAIKRGWLKIEKPKKEEEQERTFYDLWADNEDKHLSKRDQALQKMHIPAPKEPLPTHEASYNPPPEYLPTQQEIDDMSSEDENDEKSKYRLIPKKYDSLRKVPQYESFIQLRFLRNLDLYLCPRQRKMKVNVNPEDLIPDLPRPADLRPFPTSQTLAFKGHESMIRSISVNSAGSLLVSGSDDGSIRVWDVATGRCLRKFQLHELDKVKCVSWCPSSKLSLISVVIGSTVQLINPCLGDPVIQKTTDQLIRAPIPEEEKEEEDEDQKKIIEDWKLIDGQSPCSNFKWILIDHPKAIGEVVWHHKSDYFATTLPSNGHTQVLIHQLTKRQSTSPFSKCRGIVQTVSFHPSRPLFFVATQRYVRVYDLLKQELTRKLMCNSKWISSISVHPGGDNLLVGGYDRRLVWMDLDLSSKPYQQMKYHKKAIRSVQYHRKYPLFASASDDASVIIGHGLVYNDLLQNPRIVPVKVLKGHTPVRNVGVLDCCWHPTQPWIFTSAADNVIRLFT